MSKQITTTIYLLSELKGRARESALDWMRAATAEMETADIEEAACALIKELPYVDGLNAADLRAAADRAGTYYALTLAGDATEILCREKGALFLDRIGATHDEADCAINAAETALLRKIEINSLTYFSDDYLIEQADLDEYYFDDKGNLATVGI